MKTIAWLATFILVSVCMASLQVTSRGPRAGSPEFTKGDELVRPEGYRDWVFLTSGVRTISEAASAEGATFINVFVTPSAYQQFLATGNWPDKTVLVEEKRGSSNQGALNKAARYQSDLMGISVKVKDVARFPEKWGYFSFDTSQRTAQANPEAKCLRCHHDHGAVDTTFVQFYPTLKPVAQQFGTYRQAPEGSDSY